jgi:hypothetical protein
MKERGLSVEPEAVSDGRLVVWVDALDAYKDRRMSFGCHGFVQPAPIVGLPADRGRVHHAQEMRHDIVREAVQAIVWTGKFSAAFYRDPFPA